VRVTAAGTYDFNTYTMWNVRGTSTAMPNWLAHGATYALRIYAMRADWDGLTHSNQNVTPHSAIVTFTLPSCNPPTTTTTTVAPTTYSVTYNGNTHGSGSVPTDNTAYASGATVTVAGNTGTLAKTGYTFDGWCTTQPAAGVACTGTSRAATSTFAITTNTTLFAVWTANTLTVSTDEQGGSAIANASTTTGGSVADPGTPTRSGYTFNGWFLASSGGSAITFPYTHGQTANFTLYAQWTAISCAAGGACALGDTGPGGGIVFYVQLTDFTSTGSDCGTGCRYLEAAPVDQSAGVAWCSSTAATGATSEDLGAGRSNTTTADGTCTSGAIELAARYNNNGKSDWHLPSRTELTLIFNERARLSVTGTYWSSTEFADVAAWARDLGTGPQYGVNKVNVYKVRAIRAFGLGGIEPS
jgi:uncharacterized repeat protein (TIGR02543 family)